MFTLGCSPVVDKASEDEPTNPDAIHVVVGDTDYSETEALAFRVLGESNLREGIDYWSSGENNEGVWSIIVQFLDGYGSEVADEFRSLDLEVTELSAGDRWPHCDEDELVGCLVE